MAVDEQRRNALYRAAAEVLGEDHAATMFELLPPPSSDLATEASVASLGASVDQRFADVDRQFDVLRHELTATFRSELVSAVASQARLMVVAVVSTIAGVGGLAIAFAQLL